MTLGRLSAKPDTSGDRRPVRLVAATLAALLLAGCGTVEEDIKSIFSGEEAAAGTATASAEAQAAPPPAPSVRPRLKPTGPAAAPPPIAHDAPDAPAPPAGAAPSPAAPAQVGSRTSTGNPDELIGLEESGVLALLGYPGQLREQPPAKIWTYSADLCQFNIYFYLNLESQTFRALRYESTGRSGASTTSHECYATITAPNATDG